MSCILFAAGNVFRIRLVHPHQMERLVRGIRLSIGAAGLCLGLSGCLGHIVQVEPVEVEPIYMNVDVQVQVKETRADNRSREP